MTTDAQTDLDKVRAQEKLLVFKSFDEADAWRLGNLIREAVSANDESVLIDIREGDNALFVSAMPGTTAENANWARRKRNLVNLLGESSYATGLRVKLGFDPASAGLNETDHAWHGGCFPVRLTDGSLVATVTVSGLPQREDHRVVSEAIAEFLGLDLGDQAL